MAEWLESPFFGISISIVAFWAGEMIQKKLKTRMLNPLIVAIVLVIVVLSVFHIPYESYQSGGSIINMFLGPATACLAVSIYTKIEILKKNWLPILVGCTCGTLASMASIFFMCRLFGLDQAMTMSLIPKSVTTPIAVGVSESHGGIVPVTVVGVIITGNLGNIIAPSLVKFFRVEDSMTAGLSIGACSHAVGTSRAIQMGETEGAMSGLAIGICGMITVLFSLFL